MALKPLALALAALAMPPAFAATDDTAALKAELQRLAARIEALEQQNKDMEKALASDRISEKEPELVTRLKAVESQSLGMLKQARTVEALDGITAGFSFTTVAQQPSKAASQLGADIDGKFGNSQLNYRGDAYVTLPLDNIGDTESKVFAHFRFGQGFGLNDMYSFSKPNASAFRVTSTNPDDSVAILGQAWYQATIPLPFGGFKPHSKETLEVNFGKMDPFLFFDQNAAANDETKQFLNTAFVHNPLLDAGGDIGVDANGFTPGVRVSYVNKED
ncbi:MAG TPA: carbohydrate porin, partial [Rhodocyclaceae bacterium]